MKTLKNVLSSLAFLSMCLSTCNYLRTPEQIFMKCGICVFETSPENGSVMKIV
jgi:hypothetical protein